ncbi:enoyl-CoA-hydratase DpgB [Micromonospora sp. HM5-17]|uniref:enoyl-CoA-hydratase DpgB n=1 Tax=Micromonospora sp. HM5-17 TaxID=2487710 RepID=UPI001315999B|nr:enoyl-CoA-hydratase DpgB [Micromonospora sp. HM5-17]
MTDVPRDEVLDASVDTAAGLAALTAELQPLCRRVEEERPALLVLRLTGDGEWPGPVGVHDVNRWERAVRRLERLDVLTVAVAAGACGPAAVEILLAADVRVGLTDATLRLDTGAAGAWPGMGMYRLAQRLGSSAARRLLLATAPATFTATDARDHGLLDEITDGLDARVAELLRTGGRRDVSMRRSLLLSAGQTSYEVAIGTHLAACDRTLRAGRAATRDAA